MNDIAIRADNLSKRYRIGQREPYKTLRDAVTNIFTNPFQGQRSNSQFIWALKNVSLEVKRGEVIGIIGRNGAGKTTLLKVLSRITKPTRGYGEVYGRVGSLLEVGTGFHPELTGRENIYLNGAVLGMKKAEIDKKFDEIVDFAEIEKFIDTPVKRYSSGMYVRLAFAVAAHLEPEILLVDEVLAVGDAAFQKKCLGKMGDVSKEGRTVLFVSHNMAAIGQLCTRGILLCNGLIECEGYIDEVMDTYLMTAMGDIIDEVVFPEQEGNAANIVRLCLRNEKGKKSTRFSNFEPIILEVEYIVRQTLSHDHIFLLLDRADGLLVMKTSDDDGGPMTNAIRKPGRYITQIQVPGGILNGGIYQFRVVIGKRRGIQHDTKTGSYFEIEDMTDYTNSCFGKRNGALLFPLKWRERKTETL